jgi:hypothetical protein
MTLIRMISGPASVLRSLPHTQETTVAEVAAGYPASSAPASGKAPLGRAWPSMSVAG